ncbi:hypothetical protein ACPCBF_17990 [Streptomyces pseudogriseolus]|uniref:hypothetical protein n=1 Tax=Streptomyces pseudogriseolus TaxID=36817 RepID=UPI003FA2A7BD
MTTMDPLVPALAGLVVDAVWFLESCDDDEVDPDSAVKMMEGVGGELLRLPLDQRDRLLQVLADLAEAEQDAARRGSWSRFPSPVVWSRNRKNEPTPAERAPLQEKPRKRAATRRCLGCAREPRTAPGGC